MCWSGHIGGWYEVLATARGGVCVGGGSVWWWCVVIGIGGACQPGQ